MVKDPAVLSHPGGGASLLAMAPGAIWFWAENDPGHHDCLIHDRNGHWSEVTAPRA